MDQIKFWCEVTYLSNCPDPNFGLTTKARAWKGAGRECNLEVTFIVLGLWKNVRKRAHTLLSGLPFWELESLWSPKFSESNLKGWNSLDWKLPHTIEKLLKLRCLKWACMIHLSIYNTSYGQNKGQESKCQFDFKPLKVKNLPKLHVCRWCATYHWKSPNEGHNFALDLALIRGLYKKLWASKVAGVPILGILGVLAWESWKKWHLGVALWLIIENIIRGKVVASFKSKLWQVLWICVWL